MLFNEIDQSINQSFFETNRLKAIIYFRMDLGIKVILPILSRSSLSSAGD